jgi:lambda family phage minor tail protein L
VRTLPAEAIAEKNKLFTLNPWLILMDLYFDDGTFYYALNTEPVTYGGNEYTPFPLEIDLGTETQSGEIPTITARLSNISGVVQGYMELMDGGHGRQVVIHQVHAGLLDKDFSELDIYTEIQKSEFDDQWATFALGMPNPLNQRYPLYRYLAEHCNWQFKEVECGYSGAGTCRRIFADCVLLGNTRRFGGKLGLSREGVRFV